MQQLLLPTASHSMINEAAKQLEDRSPLYDCDENTLYIKYAGRLIPLSTSVDGKNIVLDDRGNISLADNLLCQGVTVQPDPSAPIFRSNEMFAEISPQRTILLLVATTQDSTGILSGNFYEKGMYTSAYHFSISTTGSRFLSGSSAVAKAHYVKATWGGRVFIGIRFPSNQEAKIYFSGYDNRPKNVLPPAYKSYTDADLLDVKPIVDESSSNTNDVVIEEGSNVWDPFTKLWDFDKLPTWLGNNNTVDFTYTTPDLGEGLYINSTWLNGSINNKVIFDVANVTDTDTGLIYPTGKGSFLRLIISKSKSSVSVRFTSSKEKKKEFLRIFNSDGKLLKSEFTTSHTNPHELTMPLPVGVYYLDATHPNTRIHNIRIDNPGNDGTIAGWNKFTYKWDFITWKPTIDGSLGNGLFMNSDITYKHNAGTLNSDKGYVTCSNIRNKPIFTIDNPNDKSNLEVALTNKGTADTNGVLVKLYNKNTIILTTAQCNANGATTFLRMNNLKAGKYFITADEDITVLYISLTNPGMGDHKDESSSVDKVEDSITNDLDKTGEGGDPHNITMEKTVLHQADLVKLAGTLKDSDMQISLDLSKCTVAPDAENWSNIFNKCLSLAKIKLPQGVKSIGSSTFGGCIFLNKIELPDSLQTFTGGGQGNSAPFSGVRARTYILPDGFQSIGGYSFANSALRNIVLSPGIKSPKKILAWAALYDTLDYIRIFMTREQYDADQWSPSDYGDKIQQGVNKNPKEIFFIYEDMQKLLTELNY